MKRSRIAWLALGLLAPMLASTPALASTSIGNGSSNLNLAPGALSVGSTVPGTLSAIVGGQGQGTLPQATWTDSTGSGAGWQGSIAASNFVYTGSWTPQGSAPALGSGAGSYTGDTDGLLITVSVGSGGSSTSTPFTWTDNSGGSGSGNATNGTPAVVEQGVTIDFATGTTYPSGSQYTVQVGTQSSSALELASANGSIAVATGEAAGSPAFTDDTAVIPGGGVGVYGTAVPFLAAAVYQGLGGYQVSPGAVVITDPSSWAATYTAQAQYTIASGPGSAPTTASSGSNVYTSLSSASTQQAAVTTDSYTGNGQTYTVPSGASWVQVTVDGAQGGGVNGEIGGEGGTVTASLPVTTGETLYIYVGQMSSGTTAGGVSGAPNNFGIGGAGASGILGGGGGGGGATSVYAGGSVQADLAMVAGAGGGGGWDEGGGGGYYGGGGGIAGGGGGSQTSGGAAGSVGVECTSTDATAGGFGYGGNGDVVACYPSGGGGGGLYGGGGGTGGDTYGSSVGAGGGGSSWATSSAQDVSYTSGTNSGNGSVIIQPVGSLPPTNLTGSYNSSTAVVNLSWTASPSSNVLGYAVFRNGTEIGTTTGTNFADTSAPANTMVSYGVEALTSGLPSALDQTSTYTDGVYGNAVITDGAVGYWPLGGDTGTATNQATGSEAQPALFYNGGLSIGSAPNTTLGGASTVFNGSSGYASATSPYSVAGNYTVAGWVNIAALPTVAGGDPYPFSTFFYYGDSGVGVRNGGCSGSATECLTVIYDGVSWQPTSYQLPLGSWMFVVMTMTSGGGGTLYINGVSVASTSSRIDSGTQTSLGGNVAFDASSDSRYFDGSEAQVAYFNTVLTASQVSALYSAGT